MAEQADPAELESPSARRVPKHDGNSALRRDGGATAHSGGDGRRPL